MSVNERIIRPATIEGDDDLELNVQDHLISQPLADIGIRNIGKSYFAGKICEELCEIKQPFIVVDPEGEYWTLRERYPVIVATLGKPMGRPKGFKVDLNVTSETAPTLAQRVAEKGYSLVLDLRNATMVDSYTVLGNFLEALYQAEAQYNRPIVLIMEEAHVLVPEVGRVRLKEIREAQNRVIYWTYEIAARGRHRGLGYLCIARRAAEVAKAVLSQCPTRIIFKLVDPSDIGWLRESGLTKEQIETVQSLPQGKALALGIADEPFYITSKQRLCSHGGKTPISMAVETPELEHAVADLTEVIKAPPTPPVPIPEEIAKKIRDPMAERDRLVKTLDSTRSEYEQKMADLNTELKELNQNRVKLETRIRELETQIFPTEEKVQLERKVQTLQEQVHELKAQLGETKKVAIDYEQKFEGLRQLWGDWSDLIMETASHLDLELVPKDIQALTEENKRLKAKLETYEREEELRKELFKTTLEDLAVRSWIRDAERFLSDLKHRGQAGPIVMKAALRMDPETAFLPEEIQTGYTAATNLNYLNMLESKGLLWEARKSGRKAFRNRLHTWVTENVRKIKPGAPDGAIQEIADRLKNSVIGRS